MTALSFMQGTEFGESCRAGHKSSQNARACCRDLRFFTESVAELSRPGLSSFQKNCLARNAATECVRFRDSVKLLQSQISSRQLTMKQVVEGRLLNALLLRRGQLGKSRLPVFQWGQLQRDPAWP